MGEDQLPYSSMLGMAAQTTPNMNPVAPGMESIMNPAAAQPLAMMHRPVQTPQELEARKSGWTELAQKLSDPNLLRALGFASASMMAPGGSVGSGLATGLTAFQAGEYANQEKLRKDQELALKTTESEARVEGTRADTALAKARVPGVEAQSQVAAATAPDLIAKAGTERKTAELALKSATSEADVATIERAIRQRKAEIEKSIPDEKLKAAALVEVEASLLKVKEARAKIAQSEAATKKSEEETKIKTAELSAIKDMKPEELRQFMTKSGPYSGTQSAYVQQANMWGTLYDKLPADDAHKKGKTREQFIQTRLTEAKQKDAIELLVKAKQAGVSDEEIESMGLFEMAAEAARARRPQPKPGADGLKLKEWTPVGNGMERRTKADGSWEYRREVKATDIMTGEPMK